MNKLHDAKIFGVIGAIFMLFGGFIIPGIGAIVGLVFLFIAVKYIADDTKDQSIFDNYLMHFILTIVAVVAIFVIFFISVGGFTFFSAMKSIDFKSPRAVWNYFSPYIVWWVLGLVIGWIFFIIAAWYLKKSYNSIAEHTKVDLYRTMGTIYFIGAITTIVLIGFLIILVAKIIEIVCFFSLPDQLPTAEPVTK